jgi:iron(III) transport system substrate-binding protein
MKFCKQSVLGAVSAVALLAGSSAAYAAMDDITPQEKALIEGAKKEGAVTIINPQFQERTATLLAEGMKKRYGLGDNFEFNNLRKGTGATVAQVRQEIQAGKFTVDVQLVSAPAFFAEAAKRGAFLELDSGQWKDSDALVKSAGQYAEYPYVVTPFAYSFQPVWNASCPGMENFNVTSYEDVMAPDLKGKTIVSDITKSFTYTNTVVALKQINALDLDNLWTKLKAQDPLIEFRTEPKMQLVVSCERPLDMWNLTGRAYQNIQKDESLKDKLKWGTYKEGQVMLGNQMAVLKGAPHPNAGKLLVEYLLSKDGADVYVAAEMLFSFRANYTPPAEAQPYLFDLTKEKLVGMNDWVDAQRDAKPVRDQWQSYFQ